MVNPVVKYKFWANADYDGLGTASTDFYPLLETELDSWITAITSNASLTGAVPIKRKGVSDSTNSNYVGLTVECPHPTAGTIYAQSYTTSTSIQRTRTLSDWSDNGTEGGYGSGTAIDTEDCSIHVSGYDQGILLAYDTTDEKEFFMAGRYSPAGFNFSDIIICIMRGTSGHWGTFITDNGVEHFSWYSQTDAAYKSAGMAELTGTSRVLFSSSAASPYTIGAGSVFVPANERIISRAGFTHTVGSYYGSSPYSVYQVNPNGPAIITGN